MSVCVCERERGNFVDEQRNRTEMVEILCVGAVGGLPEFMPIHVVLG